MTTLRSMIAYLALTIRCAGAIYIVVQVLIWHSFYTAAWRLAAPAIAVAWALIVVGYLRRRWPSPFAIGVDSAVYAALALTAQECVPPAVRDDIFSWLVICMAGQLIVPVWYASGGLSVLLGLIAPIAYLAGARLQPVTDSTALTRAVILLIVVGLVHGYGRRQLYGRAALADAALAEADQAAREQYAVLSRSVERREHERLLHDTVLNTLTAQARADSGDVAAIVDRCRRDVALIEKALREPDELAAGDRRAPGGPLSEIGGPLSEIGDLLSEMKAVVGDMRARGLVVHAEMDDRGGTAVPERVIMAMSNAAREALSNVAAHAGTAEAWVSVSLTAPARDAQAPARLRVIVRDAGRGFDPARVGRARLGLRRSITERVADCGGQSSIWSEPGRGTVVCLSWGPPW